MSTLSFTLTIPNTPRLVSLKAVQPSLVLLGDGGSRIVLPFAPMPVSHKSGMGWDTIAVAGRGRGQVLAQANPLLPTMTFDLTLARPDNQSPVEDWIGQLNNAANGTERWTVSYGPQEQGLWRLTDFSCDITQRQAITNLATVAKATITMTSAGDPTAIGPVPYKAPPPVPGPKTPPPPQPTGMDPKVAAFYAALAKDPSAALYFSLLHQLQLQVKPNPARPATYTVRSGDTLTGIAVRFYGGSKFYPLIGGANGITNSNLILVGQVLKLPGPV